MNQNILAEKIRKIDKRLSEIEIEFKLKLDEYDKLHQDVIKCQTDTSSTLTRQLDSR